MVVLKDDEIKTIERRWFFRCEPCNLEFYTLFEIDNHIAQEHNNKIHTLSIIRYPEK